MSFTALELINAELEKAKERYELIKAENEETIRQGRAAQLEVSNSYRQVSDLQEAIQKLS